MCFSLSLEVIQASLFKQTDLNLTYQTNTCIKAEFHSTSHFVLFCCSHLLQCSSRNGPNYAKGCILFVPWSTTMSDFWRDKMCSQITWIVMHILFLRPQCIKKICIVLGLKCVQKNILWENIFKIYHAFHFFKRMQCDAETHFSVTHKK